MTALEKKFYYLFWNDDVCQSIFLKPKTELLENEVELILSKEQAYPPRLVLTNSLKQKQFEETAMQRTEYQGIEVLHNLQSSLKKYFDEDRLMEYAEKKFGKITSKVREEIKDFDTLFEIGIELVTSLRSEKATLKFLNRFNVVPKGIKTLDELKKYYEAEIISDIKKFLSNDNLIELVLTIDLVSAYHNQRLKESLIAATKHSTDVLYNSENFKSRVLLFDKLYDISVVLGRDFKSYYECVNCPPDTFNGIITTNIKPSKLIIKCPNCQKETYYIVPYRINEIIYKHIIHEDGLLFFAIQYLLEERRIRFEIDKNFLKDVQIDIIIINSDNLISYAMEIKMFKTDRPKDTQIGNFRQTVGQVKKIKEKMQKAGQGDWISLPYFVVTNITDELIIKEAIEVLKQDLKDYNITILSPKQFFQTHI
ncbi:MAG: hypothetical protein K1X92_13815 [Bacteroidia bacterium]|nr:hypothetical protein [Bacteroidia bacterium]